MFDESDMVRIGTVGVFTGLIFGTVSTAAALMLMMRYINNMRSEGDFE